MKNRHFLILITFILTTILTQNTFAQVSPQWHLPEGAKARFGKGTIQEIAYSLDGTKLAVASSIGIWIYDAQTAEELYLLKGHTDKVESLSFSPDGTTLASGGGTFDGTIRLWDVSTGTHIRTIPVKTRYYPPGSVDSVAFSPDGTTLTSENGGDIHLWEVSTGTHIRMLSGDTNQVESLSFSPDGNTIAAGDTDGMIFLFDVSTGKNIKTLTGHTRWVYSVAFSPDGNTIASASGYWDSTIFLWEVSTGTHIKTLTGHTDGSIVCRSVRMAPPSQVGVREKPFYGTCPQERTSERYREAIVYRLVQMVPPSQVEVREKFVYGMCPQERTSKQYRDIRGRGVSSVQWKHARKCKWGRHSFMGCVHRHTHHANGTYEQGL